MQRACGITVWRIAPLAMARRAHDLRRAVDANANGTRMRNRAILYVHYMHVRVRGAALGMCLVRPPGCRDYAAHIRLQLVLWRMSLLGRACVCTGPIVIQVDVITRQKGVYTMSYARVRCRYGV